MNELVLHRRAAHYYKRLPENIKEALKAKLETLRDDPENYLGASRLAGEWQVTAASVMETCA